MAKTIKEIMDLFLNDPQWEIGKVKKPDPREYADFISRYTLPEDYKELLSITDGFVLYHAGDYRVDEIAWILQVKNNPVYGGTDWKDEILLIAHFMDHYLYIDQSKSDSSRYLYAGDCCSPETVCVGTITDFFNGLIDVTAQYGENVSFPFWETEGKPIFNIMK